MEKFTKERSRSKKDFVGSANIEIALPKGWRKV